MTNERPRPGRVEPRDVVELRALRTRQPELGTAVDMQIELIELYRRIQLRVSTLAAAPLSVREARLAKGCRAVELPEVPIEWAEARLALRQAGDILLRYELVEPADHRRLVAMAREGADLEPTVRAWYAETARGPDTGAAGQARPPMFDELVALALKPFFARAAEVARQNLSLDPWDRGWCPFCGAWPELAVIEQDDGRRLICGRCAGRWRWLAVGCPWCGNDEPRRLPSFTSADRRYRVCACESCRRYLKAYNMQGASRPVLPEVDLIATLPLDAAAAQRGYIGG